MSKPSWNPFHHPDNPPEGAGQPPASPAPEGDDTGRALPVPLEFRSGPPTENAGSLEQYDERQEGLPVAGPRTHRRPPAPRRGMPDRRPGPRR
jgi:hypothetical protein